MSAQDPLIPPRPITNTAANYLLAGRNRVRGDSAPIIAALLAASDTSRTEVPAMHWHHGMRSTYGGTESRRGGGSFMSYSVGDHGLYLSQLAPQVHKKLEGPCRTLGTSHYRGSSDAEFVSRSGVFIDCDDLGYPDELLGHLNSLGLAYIFQRRRPNATRWHIELFFKDLLTPSSDDLDTLRAWKNSYYRPVMGWLLGIFSELGKLECRFEMNANALSVSKLGADVVPCDRLLGLGNPYTRRESTDPIPETVFNEGGFLDIPKLLDLTGFEPPAERLSLPKSSVRTRSPQSAPLSLSENVAESEDDRDLLPLYEPEEPEAATACFDAIAGAYEKAGHVVSKVGGFAIIRCPAGSGHSTGENGDGSTAILSNGYVKCFHASCASRSQADFFRLLPKDAQEEVVEKLPEMAAETENANALFGEHIVELAARVSAEAPMRFVKVRERLDAVQAPVDRWMKFVRKVRRS